MITQYHCAYSVERQWNDATRHCWLLLPLVGSALAQGQDPSLQGKERLLLISVWFSPLLPGRWVCRGGGGVGGRASITSNCFHREAHLLVLDAD